MGTKFASTYANLIMSSLEVQIQIEIRIDLQQIFARHLKTLLR